MVVEKVKTCQGSMHKIARSISHWKGYILWNSRKPQD